MNLAVKGRLRLIASASAATGDGVQGLRGAGYSVDTGPLAPAAIRALTPLPDAFVIDLSRAPSVGRDMALFLRQVASTRYVPLVFVGSEHDVVAAIRRLIPDAAYTTWGRAAAHIRAAMARPLKAPVVPGVFAPFAGVPLARKLGIKDDAVVALINAPPGFERLLHPLPRGARVRRGRRGRAGMTLWFVRTRRELEAHITTMAPRAVGAGLWILWPKRSDGTVPDVNQFLVRKIGLAHGIVDFKIASVDATWSGLRFAPHRRA